MLISNNASGFNFAGASLTGFTNALTSNSAGWGGIVIRQFIPASALLATGNVVRLRLVPVTSGNSITPTAVWIGHAALAGDAYDYDGAQVQVLFGGSGSVTLTAGGVAKTSDPVNFPLDKTKNLIIGVQLPATADLRLNTSATGFSMYAKVASGEAGTTNVTGYTNNASNLGMVDLIEVLV